MVGFDCWQQVQRGKCWGGQAWAKAQECKRTAIVCDARDSSAFSSALQPAAARQLQIGAASYLLLELSM